MIRVTKVLDYFQEPELINWKLRVGTKEAKRISTIALKLGSKVHKFIENGKMPPPRERDFETLNCIAAFERFKQENKFEPINYEQELIKAKYDVLGHYDCLGFLNDKKTIIDWKTSSRISLKYKIQVNTYSWLCGIQHHTAILRLDKNLGQYELWHEPYNQELVDVFLAMLKVYRAFNPNGEGDSDESDSVTDNKVGDRQTMDQSEDSGARSAEDRQI